MTFNRRFRLLIPFFEEVSMRMLKFVPQLMQKMSPRFNPLQIIDIRQETEDTLSIAFAVPTDLQNEYTYKAGQYLTLRTFINGEDVRRSYSLCSTPNSGEWRVAVKLLEDGLFSSFVHNELKVGAKLDVMTPMGNFNFVPNPISQHSYALFAAGSGITPIIAITKEILENEPLSDVSLFYGNKGFSSIIFREEIESLKNRFMDRLRVVHILSRESLGNPLQKGRIDEKKCGDIYNSFLLGQNIQGVYVCGPEEMIHAVKHSMTTAGIPVEKVHFELFNTSSAKKKEVKYEGPEVKANVMVIMDGEEFELALDGSGTNILEAAHNAGADLPYACKGGVCCTCKAKVLEGEARMDVNYALEKDEVEAGYILTCQAHPVTEKLVVSFDH